MTTTSAVDPLPPCRECGRPMRRRAEPFRPGTGLHAGKGKCATCAQRARKRARRAGIAQPRTPDPAATRRVLDDAALVAKYIKARRARGVPKEGLPWEPLTS